jgi:hypothetical protein
MQVAPCCSGRRFGDILARAVPLPATPLWPPWLGHAPESSAVGQNAPNAVRAGSATACLVERPTVQVQAGASPILALSVGSTVLLGLVVTGLELDLVGSSSTTEVP